MTYVFESIKFNFKNPKFLRFKMLYALCSKKKMLYALLYNNNNNNIYIYIYIYPNINIDVEDKYASPFLLYHRLSLKQKF